jgi:ATP synthase protein I
MFKVILLQTAAVMLATAIGGSIAGSRGGISAALGGAACVLPNLLLALHLRLATGRPGAARFLTRFMLGEIVKLTLVVASLFIIAREYDDVHLPSLLIGLVLATQVLFFWGFLKKN